MGEYEYGNDYEREVTHMYNDENQFEFSVRSLNYSASMARMFEDYIEKDDVIDILLRLSVVDFYA